MSESLVHVLAVHGDHTSGDTVTLGPLPASAYGLPAKDFTIVVDGRFENSEVGHGGYFLPISAQSLTAEELAFAQKRGLFQQPSGEVAVPQIPVESNMDGPDGIVRAFVTSEEVSDDVIAQTKGEVEQGLNGNAHSNWRLLVDPYMPVRHSWQPIDYAIFLTSIPSPSTAVSTAASKHICWEAFLLLDERTPRDGSVCIVYQQTQLPVRRDPIRLARFKASAAGEIIPAIVAGSWKFENAWTDDPDEVIPY